jgi:hypothetical protein
MAGEARVRKSDWVLVLLILGLVAASVSSAHGTAPERLAFTYTTGGADEVSSTVEILADGTQRMVTDAPCARLLYPDAHISHRELERLRHLADAVRLDALPPVIRLRVMSIDMADRAITIYTPAKTTTVTEAANASNARFDRLYDALTEAAPFTLDGPCRKIGQ